MKTPPLLTGATIIFWGRQAGLLYPAIVMALVLEGARLVQSKWDLSLSDFNRVSDVCAILLAGVVIFVVSTNPLTAIMIIFKWLPMVVFPLLVAQEYSAAGRIDIRSLMLLARKKEAGREKPDITIQLSYPYIVLCIISAGSANIKDGSFYICLFFLAAWALWPHRSRRFSPILWIMMLVAAGCMGYAGHLGLYRLQNIVTDLTTGLFFKDTDPFRRTTSIGDIGELKLSDRIVFRIMPDSSPFNPVLVREAGYNTYNGSTWYATHFAFKEISPEPDLTTWKLQKDPGTGKAFTVYSPLKRGKGMLKLPNGVFQIEDLPVLRLMQNPLGAVKVEDGPGLISYRVRYNTNAAGDLPPDERDLNIPKKEMAAILQVVEELRLTSKQPAEIVSLLYDFFQEKFTYSLKPANPGKGNTPLTDFLRESRTGHCEYFATATVLILRACGIPARYASGYSAHEFSELENKIVVRMRHAHAWALVYVDGTWRNLDTTSASWVGIEEKNASKMHVFQDILSFLVFKISEWRWGTGKGDPKKYAWWLLVPLVIILARRMYVRKKIRRIKTGHEQQATSAFFQGKDSGFYRIEKRLNELGFERYPWETLTLWMKRIEQASPSLIRCEDMAHLLYLHYRGRFGANGLTQDENRRLTKAVGDVLEKF